MVDQLLIAIFAWFHIFFAMSWLGPGLFIGLILSPVMERVSPQFQKEYYAKIIPRTTVFFRVVPGLTLVFGILLLYGFVNGDVGWLWTSPSGSRISVGMALGLTAFVITNLVSIPHFNEAAKILKETKDEGALSAAAKRAIKTGEASAGVSGVLLLITLIFMVGAGFY